VNASVRVLIAALLFSLAACAVTESQDDQLSREAGVKLSKLESMGCPNNKLFLKWTFMRRNDTTTASLLYLNEQLDEAIEQCIGAPNVK